MAKEKSIAKTVTLMKDELELPQGVTALVSGRTITLKGPKGEASKEIAAPDVSLSVNGSKVVISTQKTNKRNKKMLGSTRAHVVNLMRGVSEGHVYKLKICYSHFPITVSVSGKKLTVKNFLGEKTPRELEFPSDVKIKVEGADIIVESSNKESAGQTAASIEQLSKRTNYDTRVFVDGIYLTMKDGREIK